MKYTQGGLENLELARKYFAQALRLNNRNMRALFGLYMVSAARKKVRRREKIWSQKQLNHFWNCGLSRLRLATEYVKQDCTCVSGEGAPRQVSSLLTQMVNSRIGKFSPQELFILVIIPVWWDYLVFMTCINNLGGSTRAKKGFASGKLSNQVPGWLKSLLFPLHICLNRMLSASANASYITWTWQKNTNRSPGRKIWRGIKSYTELQWCIGSHSCWYSYLKIL